MLKITRNRLIEEMHSRGYSAYDIAKKLKVAPKTIYNVINKESNPSLSLAKSLASLFGKSIDNIFEFEEE